MSSKSAPLTPELQALVAEKYGADAGRVTELLLSYGTAIHHREAERVRRGIVRISPDVATVEKYVQLAQRDYRDLIMAAEYELRDGKLRRKTS